MTEAAPTLAEPVVNGKQVFGQHLSHLEPCAWQELTGVSQKGTDAI